MSIHDGETMDKKQAKLKKGNAKFLTSNVPLIPNWLLYTAFFISFSLPNLVFSGRTFFDTLHIMKWAVTMVPIGIVSLVVGVQLIRFGAKSKKFILDPFGCVWLLLVILITSQPLFIKFTSISSFIKEWYFFAVLFAVYILSYNLCTNDRFHRVLLWGGSVNAAVNVLFAELTMRGLNKGYPFILDVSGHYIGNTAQQEMFGLWTAMAVLNCLFLHLYYVGETGKNTNSLKKPIVLANLFFLAVNSWGLWSSTARGAILSLILAFIVLVAGLWRTGEKEALRRSFKLFSIVVFFLIAVIIISNVKDTHRGTYLINKFADMLQNPTTVGSRISIWKTSWEVFLKEPVTGVGLGQYKWNFLDGQRIMFQKHPELIGNPTYDWQYTYWAHSEYLQWLCETGIIGGLMLFLLALWWLVAFIRVLMKKEYLSSSALWGCSMLFLLWFDALFSRPFHRIENAIWMSLAFALANRSILPHKIEWVKTNSDFVLRSFGVLLVGASLYGFVFLGGGLVGQRTIYNSLVMKNSAQEKYEQLLKAESLLMTQDDAAEQKGYFYLELARVQRNPELFVRGIEQLYISFIKRPSSKLLYELIQYGKQTNNKELLEKMAVYLTPGLFGVSPSGDILSQ